MCIRDRLQAHRELTEMRRSIRRMEEDVIRMEELTMEHYPVVLMDLSLIHI